MIATNTEDKLLERLDTIGRFIGQTPLFPIQKLNPKPGVEIYAKLEWQQIGASVKARPAFNIIREAVKTGVLTDEKYILDASSGNTAIAYAAIGAASNLPVTICIPENASKERKTILKSYGVNIIYTSAVGEMNEAQDCARDLTEKEPEKYYYADQYANENNIWAHYHTTGNEVFQQTKKQITHFVAGLGTTGTFLGTGKKLRELNENIRLISLQPDSAFHGLEGWKHMETARVPALYDPYFADQNLAIDTMDAYNLIKRAAREEGLLLSPSSAANLAGALKVAESIDEGVVVTVFPDGAEKYSEVMEEIFQ